MRNFLSVNLEENATRHTEASKEKIDRKSLKKAELISKKLALKLKLSSKKKDLALNGIRLMVFCGLFEGLFWCKR